MKSTGWIAAGCVALLSGSAHADPQPYGQLTSFQLVEELRGGVFGDDALGRERAAPMASIQALSSPVAFYSPSNPLLASLLAPRFEAGAMVNGFGLTSYAFAGLNWRTPQWGPLFGEVAFGGAVNDSTDDPRNMSRIDLGCPVTFRESAGLGWRISDRIDIVASIEHISHANLCSSLNPGLTSVGIRVGYRF